MRLYTHNPVVGGFIPTGRSETAVMEALAVARATVGDINWKRGNSGAIKGGATEVARAKLAAIGVTPVTLTGALLKVCMEDTCDPSGNKYTKLRVHLDGEEGGVLSLDVGSEVAQRLIQKLDCVAPGTVIAIGSFASTVTRNGREFVNHVPTCKADGEEVRAKGGFWEQAQAAANQAAEALKSMGIADPVLITRAKTSKKIDAHRKMLTEIASRFVTATA